MECRDLTRGGSPFMEVSQASRPSVAGAKIRFRPRGARLSRLWAPLAVRKSGSSSEMYCVEVWNKEGSKMSVLEGELQKAPNTEVQIAFPESRSGAKSSFNVDRFFTRLKSQTVGSTLGTTKELPSTQDFLKNGISAWPDGTTIFTEKQTAGKGRHGNQWVSPEGCLMFSFKKLLRISGTRIPYLNYVMCLAILEGIQDTAKLCCGVEDVGVRIKWPNDLYFKGQKIGGVLLNSSWSTGPMAVYGGIGLNAFNKVPTTCLDTIFSEACEGNLAVPLYIEDLLAHICSRMEDHLQILETQGFDPMKERYLDLWLHTDQVLKIPNSTDTSQLENITIKGISSTGFLLGENEAKEMIELQPDGYGLDLMDGLLQRRVWCLPNETEKPML